ncbi:hypothetical protein EBT31_06495 [bacterium]|nr:hypothetical protein [bacterium]
MHELKPVDWAVWALRQARAAAEGRAGDLTPEWDRYLAEDWHRAGCLLPFNFLRFEHKAAIAEAVALDPERVRKSGLARTWILAEARRLRSGEDFALLAPILRHSIEAREVARHYKVSTEWAHAQFVGEEVLRVFGWPRPPGTRR